jgi:ABC-type polysaccharide transport system permease subunit
MQKFKTVQIFKIGYILELGVQKIILLYNPLVYDTADVISTFVYRRGLLDADYSFASVVSLFQSVNTTWALIIPSLISTWYLVLMRTFFEGIPEELEAACHN